MATAKTYAKYKHLISTQINDWTILDILAPSDNHHTYVMAQCHCGTIKKVRLSYIIHNRTKDCGCGHRKRLQEAHFKKYEHLIGTKINGWTVLDIISPTEQCDKGHALCECECGTVKEVNLSYLIQGKSKDCGCGRKETLRKTFTKNLVGKRFGKLVARELLEESKNSRRQYLCDCDCGNKIIVPSLSLVQHHTSSCGCILSYWNMYIGQFLNKHNIENTPEYSVRIDNRTYRYDFYLPEYNLFIEYDGEQHYKPIHFGGRDDDEANVALKRVQEYDKIKNSYCEQNGINLLRIPYWETKNIVTIISNHLQRLNEKGLIKSA